MLDWMRTRCLKGILQRLEFVRQIVQLALAVVGERFDLRDEMGVCEKIIDIHTFVSVVVMSQNARAQG
jgi:hypothetical protein